MLPRVDNALRPVAAVEPPTAITGIGDARQDVLDRISRISLGTHLRGDILSKLADGSFFVKVGGATARMALPGNVTVGDRLDLTLIAHEPRPTFQLDNSLNSGNAHSSTTAFFVTSDLSAELGGDSASATSDALPTNALSKTYFNVDDAQSAKTVLAQGAEANTSAPTTLSNTAKLIDTILQFSTSSAGADTSANATSSSGNGAFTNRAGILQGASPLIPTGTDIPPTGQLAASLKQTLDSSGLFYESHVADWAQGKLPLASLQREPQAALPIAGQIADDRSPNVSDKLLSNATGIFASGTPDVSGGGDRTTMLNNPTIAHIVHAQLDALDQQRIAWQGALSGNIAMQWEVSRRHGNPQHDNPDQASAEQNGDWQSVVKLDFPELGKLSANIYLRNGQLQLQLSTETAESASLLNQHAALLKSGLLHTGSPLAALSIRQAEMSISGTDIRPPPSMG